MRAAGFELDAALLQAEQRVQFVGPLAVDGVTYRVTLDYPSGFPYTRPEAHLPDVPIQPTDQHRTLADGQLCLRATVPDEWEARELGTALLPDIERWIRSHLTGVWENAHEAPDLLVLPRQRPGVTVLFDDEAAGDIASAGAIVVDGSERGNAPLLHVREIGGDVRFPALLRGKGVTRLAGIYTTLREAPVALAAAMRDGERITPERAAALIGQADGTVVLRKGHGKKQRVEAPKVLAMRFPMTSGSKSAVVWEVLWWDAGISGYVAAQVHYRTSTFNRLRGVVDLERLERAHVAVLGVGAIGGTVALELARAGVGTLTLIDNDVLATGNLARHVGELSQVGLPKTCAVAEQIRRRFPGTTINERFAGGQIVNLLSHYDELVELAKNVDAVAVCVGNDNLHRFVNQALLEADRLGVYAWVGPDAVAGRVIRITPGESGCYWCYEHWVEDVQREHFVQLPRIADVNALPLDYGCNTPAIPGSSFDHGRIAFAQTRQVLQVVLGANGMYPYDETPHMVLTNRPLAGITESDFERSITYARIQKVPYCPVCGTRDAAGPSADDVAIIAEFLANP